MAWAAIWDARGTRMRAPFAAIFMSLACRDCPILAYIGVLLYSENVKREHARRGTTMTTAKQQAWKNDIIERMDASLEEVFSDAKRSGLSEDEAYALVSAIDDRTAVAAAEAEIRSFLSPDPCSSKEEA